jgi:5'-AMP-activated protein kinase catalytic alpha subunit
MRRKKLAITGTSIAENDNNPLPNFTIGKSIGEGTFGKVYLGTHDLTEVVVAIKVLEKSKISEQDDIERINREIRFLKKFRNINIIKIYEVIENKQNVYFIMEYAPGGELFNYIVSKKKLDEEEASFFFSQIIHALDFIHKQNIAHRDVKPENMLLTENNTIKFIDFGLSNQYNKGGMLKTPCGSPCYAAPEMILGRKYGGAHIDIWSCGITLYAMMCGYLPFEDPNNDKLYKKILDCKIEFPSHIGELSKSMITRLLTVNPLKRITFDQIHKHPFLKLSSNLINKSNFGLFLNKVDNSIIEKMMEMGFNKDTVIKEVEANNHNNTTTTYELLRSKLKGTGEVIPIVKKERKEKIKSIDTGKIKLKKTISGDFYDDPEKTERAKNDETNLGRNLLDNTMDYKAQNKNFLKIFNHTGFDEEKISKMSLIELFETERTNYILK